MDRRAHAPAAVEWVLHGAGIAPSSLTELVGRIAAGRVGVGGGWQSRWPLPTVIAGPLRLELDLANRSSLVATGSSLECRVDGTPVFTDSLAC